MPLVVDASVVVRWLFRIDQNAIGDELIRSEESLIAPDLVFVETTNAAWKLVNFEKFSSADVAGVLADAYKIFDEIVPSSTLINRAFEIAVDLRHPVYDCFYLALAEMRDCAMVTADQRLLARCEKTPFAKRVKPLITARSGRRR